MITPGEIQEGMFVTVVSWNPKEISNISMFSDPLITPPTITIHNDKSWCGDVLKVLAVDLPYVAVLHHARVYGSFKLDTRECQLKELKKEYVKALTHK